MYGLCSEVESAADWSVQWTICPVALTTLRPPFKPERAARARVRVNELFLKFRNGLKDFCAWYQKFGTAMIQASDKRLRGLTVQRHGMFDIPKFKDLWLLTYSEFLEVNGVFIPKRSRIYEFQISIHKAWTFCAFYHPTWLETSLWFIIHE